MASKVEVPINIQLDQLAQVLQSAAASLEKGEVSAAAVVLSTVQRQIISLIDAYS